MACAIYLSPADSCLRMRNQSRDLLNMVMKLRMA